MNQKEAIKKAFEKGYRVLSDGRVKFGKKFRKLNYQNTKYKYWRFTVQFHGEFAQIYVHRLAAYQLYGEYLFKKGICVRHVNGNSLDNDFKNIKIGTASDNMMDKSPYIRMRSAKIAANKLRKFSDEEIKNMRLDSLSGMSYNYISKKYHTCKSNVHYIIHEKTNQLLI
jgi:hypothetical protein